MAFPPIEDIANGILIILLGLIGYFGMKRGRVSAGKDSGGEDVSVVGAMVDNGAIFKLATAIEAQTNSQNHMARSVEKASEASVRASEEIRELAKEIRETTNTFVRHMRN